MLTLEFNLPFYELAIMGEDALQQREQLGKHYTPNMVIAGGNEGNIPFLEDKPRKEEVLFYVCEVYVCKAPLKVLSEVLEVLG